MTEYFVPYFSVAVTKCPHHSSLREKGFVWIHSLGEQFIMVGKAWQQEYKAAGHTVSVRTQKAMNAGAQLTFSCLYSPGSQPREGAADRVFTH